MSAHLAWKGDFLQNFASALIHISFKDLQIVVDTARVFFGLKVNEVEAQTSLWKKTKTTASIHATLIWYPSKKSKQKQKKKLSKV